MKASVRDSDVTSMTFVESETAARELPGIFGIVYYLAPIDDYVPGSDGILEALEVAPLKEKSNESNACPLKWANQIIWPNIVEISQWWAVGSK